MKRLNAQVIKEVLERNGIEYKQDLYQGGKRFRLNKCLFDENHLNCACFIAWADGNVVYTCRHESCNHGVIEAVARIDPDFVKDNSFDFRSPSKKRKSKAENTNQGNVGNDHDNDSIWGGKDGDKFLFNKVGDLIIKKNNAKIYNGKVYVYHDGKYTCEKQIISQVIRSYYSEMRKSQKAEVLEYIADYAPTATEADPRYVLFANGIYDLMTGKLLPLSSEYFITNCIPHEYKEDAYSLIAEQSLRAWACNDDQIGMLLGEAIGYSMYRSARFKKAFILLGDHDSGKSTFIRMLSVLLGADNISSLDLKELSERFNKADLSGTLCNLGDDISSDYIADSALFKKVTGGSRIKGEYKGVDGFNFTSCCTLIFSANKMPKIEDKSGASTSRIIFIPFDANFKESSGFRNVNLTDLLSTEEAIQYFIKVGIDGLRRLISTGGSFTKAKKSTDLMQAYEIENDSVKAFLMEYDPEEYVLNNTRGRVHSLYYGFCNRNNYTPVGEVTLGKLLRKLLHYETELKRIQTSAGVTDTQRVYIRAENVKK